MTSTAPALIVLEDGRSFLGQSFGAEGEAFGVGVFATGMTGYQEMLTDPAHRDHVIVATAPHIGNTGWNDEDNLSDQITASALVVRDPSPRPSSWRATRSLIDEMKAQSVVGICGVDTRALTRHLRDRGALRVGVSTLDLDPASLVLKVRSSTAGGVTNA